jgi:hypothetical protein
MCTQSLSPWRQSTVENLRDHHFPWRVKVSSLRAFLFPEVSRVFSTTHSEAGQIKKKKKEKRNQTQELCPHHVCHCSESTVILYSRLADREELFNQGAHGKLGGREEEGEEEVRVDKGLRGQSSLTSLGVS